MAHTVRWYTSLVGTFVTFHTLSTHGTYLVTIFTSLQLSHVQDQGLETWKDCKDATGVRNTKHAVDSPVICREQRKHKSHRFLKIGNTCTHINSTNHLSQKAVVAVR